MNEGELLMYLLWFVAGCIVTCAVLQRGLKKTVLKLYNKGMNDAFCYGYGLAGKRVVDIAKMLKDQDKENSAAIVGAVAQNLNEALDVYRQELCKEDGFLK